MSKKAKGICSLSLTPNRDTVSLVALKKTTINKQTNKKYRSSVLSFLILFLYLLMSDFNQGEIGMFTNVTCEKIPKSLK